MTIEYMRDLMREKVVPEELVPQNLINCLIDEEAEPPKLDAFAFLMRLRALGIGSADFVNLLSGCGAPEEVVEKIRANPAMNLQGLIVTLDNSELDSEDYTRMLLTAASVGAHSHAASGALREDNSGYGRGQNGRHHGALQNERPSRSGGRVRARSTRR